MRKSFTGVTHDDDCDPCVMDDREPLPGSGLRFATLLEGLAIGVTSTMMAEPVEQSTRGIRSGHLDPFDYGRGLKRSRMRQSP
jgi:hypothetical protein